jgi:oryzin
LIRGIFLIAYLHNNLVGIMLSLLSILSLSATVLASPIGIRDDRPKFVPGKYLVQFQTGVNVTSIAAHHDNVRRLARRDGAEEPIERTFHIGDLNAYLGTFDEEAINEIANLDEVVSVVHDEYVYLERTDFPPLRRRALTTQSPSIWSLGDLSHTAAGSTEYVYDTTAGQGMTAYVFDTGIRLSHQEFEGRARFGYDGIRNSADQSGASKDTDGHGTHCAATVVGKTYGVAKKASVVDVKVFDGSTGTISAILSGIQWAVNDVVSRGTQRSTVFSMSLSSVTASTMIDDAVKAAFNAGLLSVVAAGNSNQPIGITTPARLPEAFTVGMTSNNRSRVNMGNGFGSNYGPEMDVFAPGRDIISASHLSDNGTAVKSGTSMATPLVAGLVCYLRALEGGLDSPKAVGDRILALALRGVVSDVRSSPNILVNNGSGA